MDAFIYPELFYGNIGNSSSLTNQNQNEIASSRNKSHKTNTNSTKTKQSRNALANENNKTSSSLSTTSTTTSSITTSSTPSSETQEQIATTLSNHNQSKSNSDKISNKRYHITSRIKPLTSIEAQKLTSQLIKYNYGLGSKPFKITNSDHKSQITQSDTEKGKNKTALDSFLPQLESPTGLLFDSSEMKFKYPSKELSESSKALQQQQHQQQNNQESGGTMVTHAVLIDLNRQSIETLMPKLTDKLRKKHYYRYLLNKKNMHRQNKASSQSTNLSNDTTLLTGSNSNLDGHQDSSRRSRNSFSNLDMNLEGSKMSIKSCEENSLRKTSHLKEAISSKTSFRLRESIDDFSFETTTSTINQPKSSYRTDFRLKPLQLQQYQSTKTQQENNFSDANCTSTNSFILRNDEESKLDKENKLTNNSKQSNSQKPTITINSKTKLSKLVRLEFEDVNANKPKEATLTKPRHRLSSDLNETITNAQHTPNDHSLSSSSSRQSQQFYQRQYFKSKQRNYSGVNNKLDFSEFLDDETSNDVTAKSIELFEKDSLQSDFYNYYDTSLRVESPHKLEKSMPDDYKHYSHSSVHVLDLQHKKGRGTSQSSYDNYSKRTFKNQHLLDLFQSDNNDKNNIRT